MSVADVLVRRIETQITRLSRRARFSQLSARRWRLLAAIAEKPADDLTIPYAREDIADIDRQLRAVVSLYRENQTEIDAL